MTSTDLQQLTVKDLRALAERHGLSLPAKLRKDQLVTALLPLIQEAPAVKPISAPVEAPAGSSSLATAAAPAAVHQGPDPGLPIPDQYGIDRLVLLVQDPHHIFAYWEITAATHQRASGFAGDGATPVLLIEGQHGTEQREIDLRGGNYYLTVAPGTSYRARLALRSRDGRLHALCADSNIVATPAIGPSERHDEAWMEVDEHFHELLERSGSPAVGESSLNRFLKRSLNAREVAVGEDTVGELGDNAGLLGGAASTAGGESSSSRLGKRVAVGGLSSHTLQSSHVLAGGLSSHLLSSHSLSSHSLSSGVFSSHSRWSTTPVFVQESPGLPSSPKAANPVENPSSTISTGPVAENPASPASPTTGPSTNQPAAPTAAVPPPRPGQISGVETIKKVPARRRPR